MKISHEIPPIYQKCKETFNVDWNEGLVLTYGDTVYCKDDLSPDLEVHEATHIIQQTSFGVEKWWNKYFEDPKFRLEQEKEAYLNQWNWLKKNIKNREVLNKFREHIMNSMVKCYGEMITLEEARVLINRK